MFTFTTAITAIVLWGCASNPPLIKVAYDGDVTRVQELLENGTDVNIKGGSWDETAINAAARQGHLDTVKKLLGAGADVNLPTKYGGTPLTGATWIAIGMLRCC